MNSAIWREFLPLVFTMSAPDGEEYAQLVREQLEALGYNSASIPENVLRRCPAGCAAELSDGTEHRRSRGRAGAHPPCSPGEQAIVGQGHQGPCQR